MMGTIRIIDSNNIQYGTTKIFMRDPEKLLLDDHLHRIIMEKILTLQRWIRAQLEQMRYQKFRQGIIKLQVKKGKNGSFFLILCANNLAFFLFFVY